MNRLAVATACGLGLAILAVAIYAWSAMADTAACCCSESAG